MVITKGIGTNLENELLQAARQVNMIRFVIALILLTALADIGHIENCLKVDDDNTPAVILSGRITNRHDIVKNSDLRAAEGPYLKLDAPLPADVSGGMGEENCYSFGEAPVHDFGENGEKEQLARWQNRHVVISGKLGRFGSALVSPPIFIWVTTIKGK